MPNIASIRPGQFPRALEWNALAEAYNAGAIGSSGGGRGLRFRGAVKGKNNSGSDRERFDCMSLAGTEIALTTDGQVDLIFSLEDADASEVPAILIGSIEDGQLGDVIIDGLALALVGPAGATSDQYAVPDPTNHRLEPQADESNIRLLAEPSTSVETLCPVLLGSGSAISTAKAFTPSGGIPAQTGSSFPFTPGVATTCLQCEDYDDSGTIKTRLVSPNVEMDVYNTTSEVIEGEVIIQCKKIGGRWHVDVADCTSSYSGS